MQLTYNLTTTPSTDCRSILLDYILLSIPTATLCRIIPLTSPLHSLPLSPLTQCTLCRVDLKSGRRQCRKAALKSREIWLLAKSPYQYCISSRSTRNLLANDNYIKDLLLKLLYEQCMITLYIVCTMPQHSI